MIFTCKNCDGNMVYNPTTKMMYCPFCESTDSYEKKHANPGQLTLFCPNCGGQIEMEEHDSAMQCPYCDNYIIQDQRVEGEYLPHFMIPFKNGKEECKAQIREHFKKFKFAPTDFLSEARLNTIQGHYIPFWFFDYDTNAVFEGIGTRVKTWSSGNMKYTETSYYDVKRSMKIPFRKIPADASIKMPDDVMDLMEPYDYTQFEGFDPKVLSGFKAEKYNMGSGQVEKRARDKMNSDAKGVLAASCSGYASLQTNVETITPTSMASSYGLLPVWKYDYEYKGVNYPFYVNGQTGKIVGAAPVSKAKVKAYSITMGAAIAMVGTLIGMIVTAL